MDTKTTFKPSATLNANLADLPILKHFDTTEITTSVNSFRKGEKGIFRIIQLILLGGVGYLAWKYILPAAFIALGQITAIILTAAALVGAFILAPVFIRATRTFARFLHKKIIGYDPFAVLEKKREEMVANQAQFRISKGKISQLKNDMEIDAHKAEEDAKSGQDKILKSQAKANKIKAQMDDMVTKGGTQAKSEDDYVNLASDYQKTLADASRIIGQTNQAKDFVTKYGSRAAVMKKLGQKLTMVETGMDIKLSDFDATVDMLKKDYEFGQKANQATAAAKNAMGFTKGWEFDYALDVVTQTIAADIATTAGNLKDIDTLATNYTVDSDELYDNLNQIADKIKVGTDIVPDAKKYENPDYKFTSDDKLKSGGFSEVF